MEGIEQQLNTPEIGEENLTREERMEEAERRVEERFVKYMEEKGKIANIIEHGVETER